MNILDWFRKKKDEKHRERHARVNSLPSSGYDPSLDLANPLNPLSPLWIGNQPDVAAHHTPTPDFQIGPDSAPTHHDGGGFFHHDSSGSFDIGGSSDTVHDSSGSFDVGGSSDTGGGFDSGGGDSGSFQ